MPTPLQFYEAVADFTSRDALKLAIEALIAKGLNRNEIDVTPSLNTSSSERTHYALRLCFSNEISGSDIKKILLNYNAQHIDIEEMD